MNTPDRYDGLINSVWTSLKAAAGTRSPLNFLQLATIGLDGNPKLRMVVLRDVDITTATLTFHTDLRSPKIAVLRARPAVSILAYDREPMIQIRMEGAARFEEDEAERQSCWDALREHSVAIYRTRWAPGTIISEGNQPEIDNAQSIRGGYEHFCVVRILIARSMSFAWQHRDRIGTPSG